MSDENTVKQSNPKDAVGTRKAPMSTVPAEVMLEIGLGMLEGARKYGRHNYRAIGVRASVYYDAAMRHLMAWWEGEDIDPASGIPHISKALATLTVLRDAEINRKCVDDRPPRLNPGWVELLNAKAGEIVDKYPDAKEPYTEDEPTLSNMAALNDPPIALKRVSLWNCLIDGHKYGRAEGETAYKCIYCRAVPELKKQECEHDWMNYVIPGEAPMQHCRKCSAKRLLQKSDDDQ